MIFRQKEMEDLYSRLERLQVFFLRAQDAELKQYAKLLNKIPLYDARDKTIDERLKEIISPLRRFMFDSLSVPVSASSVFYNYMRDTADDQRRRRELAISYPSLTEVYSELRRTYEQIVRADRNPLLDCLCEKISGQRSLIVVARRSYVDCTRAAVNSADLIADVCSTKRIPPREEYDNLFAVGIPSWFPESIRRAPSASRIYFVSYDWLRKPSELEPFLPRPLAVRAMPVIQDSGLPGPGEPEENVFIPPEIETLTTWRSTAMKEAAADLNAATERIAARLAIFENGWTAFLSADDSSRELVVYRNDKGTIQIVRKRTADLEVEDGLLLRYGSGGDYVQEIADELLGSGATELRALQQQWKFQLRQFVKKSQSLESAARILRMGGCTVAEPQNIRNWLSSKSIGLGSKRDWDALCKMILADANLGDSHWQAMTKLRRAHVKAGNEIRRELLQQLVKTGIEQFELSGTQIVSLPGREGISVVLLSLIEIGQQVVEISPSRLDHPIER